MSGTVLQTGPPGRRLEPARPPTTATSELPTCAGASDEAVACFRPPGRGGSLGYGTSLRTRLGRQSLRRGPRDGALSDEAGEAAGADRVGDLLAVEQERLRGRLRRPAVRRHRKDVPDPLGERHDRRVLGAERVGEPLDGMAEVLLERAPRVAKLGERI